MVAGDLAWSATRATVYGIVVLGVIAIFGLVSSWWALAIPLFVVLGAICFSVIGYTFTTLIPKIDLYSYFFTLFITPMFLFSGLFFPFNQLPDWVHVVAWFMPALPPRRDHARPGHRARSSGRSSATRSGWRPSARCSSRSPCGRCGRSWSRSHDDRPMGTMPRRESPGRTLHRADGCCRSAGDPGSPRRAPQPVRRSLDLNGPKRPGLLDKVNAIGSAARGASRRQGDRHRRGQRPDGREAADRRGADGKFSFPFVVNACCNYEVTATSGGQSSAPQRFIGQGAQAPGQGSDHPPLQRVAGRAGLLRRPERQQPLHARHPPRHRRLPQGQQHGEEHAVQARRSSASS